MTHADLFSIGRVFEHKGKSYEVRDLNQAEQGQYQRWLEDLAREAVDRGRYTSQEAKAAADNLVSRDIASGVYEWEGEVCIAALQRRSGVQKLWEIMFKIPAKLAKEIVDERIGTLVRLVKARQDNDPKGMARELQTLGLPADFLSTRKPSSSGSGTRRSGSRKKKSRR